MTPDLDENALALALARGLVTSDQANAARAEAVRRGRSIGDVILERGAVAAPTWRQLLDAGRAPVAGETAAGAFGSGFHPPAPASSDTLPAASPGGDASPLAVAVPPPSSGSDPAGIRFGDYEVQDVLGSGGMGTVYRARHVRLGRLAAIKVINQATDLTRQRFRAEALAVARLQHPNIAAVYDAGTSNGRDFIAMELVEGETLAQRIERGMLREEVALGLALKIARALAHAHGAGVIHRDLKPENIIFDRDDEPKVADFGLARLDPSRSVAELAADAPRATRAGVLLGTPSYMSPEQARGRDVDERTDLFSLGVCLYEMLTGVLPFEGASIAELIVKVCNIEPVPPIVLAPRIARETEAICLRALEKEPGNRYRDATTLADDIERRLRGEPTLARPLGPIARSWRRLRRSPLTAILAAVALGAVASAGAAGGWVLTRPGSVRVAVLPPPLAADESVRLVVAPILGDGTRGEDLVDRAVAAGEEAVFVLPPGGYRVALTRDRFEPVEDEIVVARGHERALVLHPPPLVGRIDLVTSPEAAIIELAPGTENERRAASFLQGAFPIGEHRYRVFRRGFHPTEGTIRVVPGDAPPTTRRVNLAPLVIWEASQTDYLGQLLVGAPSKPWLPSVVYSRNMWSKFHALDGSSGGTSAMWQPSRPVMSFGAWALTPDVVGADGTADLWGLPPGGLGTLLVDGRLIGSPRPEPWPEPIDAEELKGTIAVVGDLGLLATRGQLAARRLTDGALAWKIGGLPAQAKLSAGDVDGDGAAEIIVAGKERIVAIETTGEILGTTAIKGVVSQPALVHDADGDGLAEVYAVTAGGALLGCRPGREALLFRRRITTEGRKHGGPTPLALLPRAEGDLIVVGAWIKDDGATTYRLVDPRSGEIVASVAAGTLPTHGSRAGAGVVSAAPPLTVDWDHDGRFDLVTGVGSRVRVWGDPTGAGGPRVLLDHELDDTVIDAVGADVDGDGRPDLVVCSQGGRIQRLSAPVTIWRQRVGGGITMPPAVAGDRLWIASQGAVVAYDRRTGHPLEDTGSIRHILTGDVNGDGIADEVALPAEYGFDLYRGEVRAWRSDPVGAATAVPALFDANGDGILDVIAGATTTTKEKKARVNGLHLFDGRDGKRLWFAPTGASAGYWGDPPAIGDLDGDGALEVVGGDQHGVVHAVDAASGVERWRGSAGAERRAMQIRNTPALHDIDADGVLDVILIGADLALHALSGRDGRNLARAEIQTVPESGVISRDVTPDAPGPELLAAVGLPGRTGLLVCFSRDLQRVIYRTPLRAPSLAKPVLGDVTGDGELEAIVADTSGCIGVFRARDGAPLFAFVLPAARFSVEPTIAQIDDDGIADIVAVTDAGDAVVLRGGGRPLVRSWTHARGDASATAVVRRRRP